MPMLNRIRVEKDSMLSPTLGVSTREVMDNNSFGEAPKNSHLFGSDVHT